MGLTANLFQGQGQPQDPFSAADAVNNRGITLLAMLKEVFSRMLGPNKQPNNIQAHLGDLFGHLLFLVNQSTEAQCDDANAMYPPCSPVGHTVSWGTQFVLFLTVSAQEHTSGKTLGRAETGWGKCRVVFSQFIVICRLGTSYSRSLVHILVLIAMGGFQFPHKIFLIE